MVERLALTTLELFVGLGGPVDAAAGLASRVTDRLGVSITGGPEIPSPRGGEGWYRSGDVDSNPAALIAASSSFRVGSWMGELRFCDATRPAVSSHIEAALLTFFEDCISFSLSSSTCFNGSGIVALAEWSAVMTVEMPMGGFDDPTGSRLVEPKGFRGTLSEVIGFRGAEDTSFAGRTSFAGETFTGDFSRASVIT